LCVREKETKPRLSFPILNSESFFTPNSKHSFLPLFSFCFDINQETFFLLSHILLFFLSNLEKEESGSHRRSKRKSKMSGKVAQQSRL